LVVEGTLSSAEQDLFRGGCCKAALGQEMREHVLLGKLLKGRRSPGYLVGGVHCSLGLSLRHRVLEWDRLG